MTIMLRKEQKAASKEGNNSRPSAFYQSSQNKSNHLQEQRHSPFPPSQRLHPPSQLRPKTTHTQPTLPLPSSSDMHTPPRYRYRRILPNRHRRRMSAPKHHSIQSIPFPLICDSKFFNSLPKILSFDQQLRRDFVAR